MALSFQGQQASESAKRGLENEIKKNIIDNWYVIHPEKDAPAPTTANVLKVYKEWTNPPPDADGNVPAYVEKAGKQIPTQATIDKVYAQAAGESVDQGTSAFGSSWLGTIVTAIRAFADWMSGGSASFTEAYAKISAEGISTAYEEKLKGLGPEHQQFITENKLVSRGKEKITEAVNVKAGLVSAAPEFDVDRYKRPEPPQAAKLDGIKGDTPDEKVAGITTEVIRNIENRPAFKDALANLPDDKKELLEKLKKSLVKNTQSLSQDPANMSDPKAFAEKAIDQTCEDCNITRAQRKEYGMLLNVLRNDLEAAHPHIAAAATGKQMSQEEFTAAKEKSQQMHLEGMVKSGRETEAEIRDTVGRASEQAIKDKIVDTVVDKHNGGFFGWSAIKKDAVVITEHNKNPTAASEASPDLKRARDNVYLFARQDSTISYRTPSEIQVQKIAQVTGNAVAEATKSAAGKNFSKEEMANHVETTVRQHLKEQESEIDKLDTPIATLNQRIGVDSKTKKPTDLLDSVAKGVGDKVRNNEKLADGQGVYDRLTTAQKVLVEAKDAQMKMHASTANVKAPDVKHDKVDLPPNGHSVSAQPSQKVVATVAARTPGSH